VAGASAEMEDAERKAIVEELSASFSEAVDMSPGSDQPLHVLLPKVDLLPPWTSPVRALVRFVNWPQARPEFWIDMAAMTPAGQAPRSSSEQLVLGESWRQFSYGFAWPQEPATPTRAVQLWLNRFREET
jgi:hypothetical protein